MELREQFAEGSLEVQVCDLLVATADGADQPLEEAICAVLRVLRDRLGMDVVYVAEFINGQRVFREIVQPEEPAHFQSGASDPLEETWCQRVVDGRMPQMVPDIQRYVEMHPGTPRAPFPVGTFLSAPIVLDNGRVYGTLCCLSFAVNEGATKQDLARLKYTAGLVAQRLSQPSH